jgi:hypothetical protein
LLTVLGLAVPGPLDAVAFTHVAGTAAGIAALGALLAALTIRGRVAVRDVGHLAESSARRAEAT